MVDTRRCSTTATARAGSSAARSPPSPPTRPAALGVAGMNYSTLLERSADFDPFAAILDASRTHDDLDQRSLLLLAHPDAVGPRRGRRLRAAHDRRPLPGHAAAQGAPHGGVRRPPGVNVTAQVEGADASARSCTCRADALLLLLYVSRRGIVRSRATRMLGVGADHVRTARCDRTPAHRARRSDASRAGDQHAAVDRRGPARAPRTRAASSRSRTSSAGREGDRGLRRGAVLLGRVDGPRPLSPPGARGRRRCANAARRVPPRTVHGCPHAVARASSSARGAGARTAGCSGRAPRTSARSQHRRMPFVRWRAPRAGTCWHEAVVGPQQNEQQPSPGAAWSRRRGRRPRRRGRALVIVGAGAEEQGQQAGGLHGPSGFGAPRRAPAVRGPALSLRSGGWLPCFDGAPRPHASRCSARWRASPCHPAHGLTAYLSPVAHTDAAALQGFTELNRPRLTPWLNDVAHPSPTPLPYALIGLGLAGIAAAGAAAGSSRWRSSRCSCSPARHDGDAQAAPRAGRGTPVLRAKPVFPPPSGPAVPRDGVDDPGPLLHPRGPRRCGRRGRRRVGLRDQRVLPILALAWHWPSDVVGGPGRDDMDLLAVAVDHEARRRPPAGRRGRRPRLRRCGRLARIDLGLAVVAAAVLLVALARPRTVAEFALDRPRC